MATTTIYALCEPDLQVPVIRYIGKTVHLKRRLSEHLCRSVNKNNHLGCWLRSLKTRGERPVLMTLTEVPSNMGTVAEMLYIRLAREGGMDLVNATDGGEGASGCPLSSETKENIREKKRGLKRPTDTSSRFVGVCWDDTSWSWKARLGVSRKQKFLGRFGCEIAAARAYDAAALKFFGPKAKLNFPISPYGP